MFVVPVVTPKIAPLVAPIVATDVVPLSHVPPAGLPDSVIVALTHNAEGPVIGNGFTLIVISFMTLQPVGAV